MALVLYALPTLAEVAFLRFRDNPWGCVVFGDFLGCAVLFGLGLRKMAITIYAGATATEGVLLFFKILSPKWVVLMTNVAPTLALAAVVLCMFSLEHIRHEE